MDIMNIGIISSKEHLVEAKIMLLSFACFNKRPINVFLFHKDLNENDIKKLSDISDAKIIPYKIDPEYFSGIVVDGHFGIYSYFRLLAPYILPKTIKKILWLDTDLIIQSDLNDYYMTDFKDKSLVASPSVFNLIGKGLTNDIKSKYHIPYKTIYFNAGVLLLNLDKMRSRYSQKYIINFIHENNEMLPFIDQDVLNVLYYDDVILSDKYLYNFSPKDENVDRNINSNSIKQAKIIHYCGSLKPSVPSYRFCGFKNYWQFAKKVKPLSFIFVSVGHLFYLACRNLKHTLKGNK